MKHTLFLFLASVSVVSALEKPRPLPAPTPPPEAAPALPAFRVPEDPRAFTNNPEGAGVTLTGLDDALRPFTTVTVTFPSDMVGPDRIDAEGSESPVVVWPPTAATFTWSTPTQGNFTVEGPLIPGQTYRFRLREGLKDASGSALETQAWGAEMTAPGFAVTEENYGERDRLNALPQVPIELNYPIRLADAAQGAWFQDRATRQRFPAEVLLNVPEGESAAQTVDAAPSADDKIYAVRFRPQAPLPVGAFYDLVVEDVRDAYAGRGLPYPRVFPLGPTRPLEVDYVQARNAPLEKPSIAIKFRQELSDAPLPADALTVEPAVPGLHALKDGAFVTLEGDFQIGTKYTVTLSDTLRSAGGYPLAKPEKWGATFRPRRAAILFPDTLIRQRSTLGLRFAFYQINTGELTWKLAPIPPEKLAAIVARSKEFTEELDDHEGNPAWTEDGFLAQAPTELLIPAFELTPSGTGTVPASPGDTETLREISWKPADGAPSGPMLLEVTGRDAKGRVIGNRAIIFFGDTAITRKVTPTETILRVARMTDGQPVAGAAVKVLDPSFLPMASGTTDTQGIVSFPQTTIPGAEFFVAEAGGVSTMQPVALSDAFPSGSPSASQLPPLRSHTFTDRPLYRPGQEVSFKGMVRKDTAGTLQIPTGRTVKWTIGRSYGGDVFASGETKIDAHGGWAGRWTPPPDAPLGELAVKALLDNTPLGRNAPFRIEEFRNPPFSVLCEAQESRAPAESTITVESQYFHGAPNAGASVTWTATWIGDSDGDYYDGDATGFKRVDLYSEHRKDPTYLAETTGTTALDGNGQTTLTCAAPFKDPGNRARCQVLWKVEVTGPDGQTITGGTEHKVAMEPVLLGVRSEEQDGPIAFTWEAEGLFGAAPDSVKAELFHVVTKSVKERLAPNVYRFRNTDHFIPVETRERVTEKALTFAPKEPGRYVLVLSPPPETKGMPVSEEVFLSGDSPSENPVRSDTALSLTNTRTPPDKPWMVGETAVLNVLAPTPGVAWITVETDRLLDTFTQPLPGNTSRIEIPVKPEYEPNAFVTVYLLRPGGTDRLAGEMFGMLPLAVSRTDRRLDLAVAVDRSSYQPREKISGTVRVSAAGQPVAGADLAIYAVDDSILTLGGWNLPSFLADFFPARRHAITTFSTLRAYGAGIAPSLLTSKGFVIGDGGEEAFGNVAFTRKEFRPILFWKPSVPTDASGVARFSCEAPDNLTRFRVIAVGQTKANQFGAGDTTFDVTKNLLIEPALPRFVREGDTLELRAVARQKESDSEPLSVRCSVGGGLELQDEPVQKITAAKNAPVVVRFKAKATAVGSGTVKFEIASTAHPKRTDAVEIPLPVAEPVILKKESVGGRVGNTKFAVAEVAPGAWENARGTFSFALSTTPWLAKIMGLPSLLEYPHGCFEQKTSRLLVYTHLAGLLPYLPNADARKKNYARVIDETLREIEASLLPGARVPYWPRGPVGSDYVTIQTAWCVAEAEAAGFDVPERLATELPEILEKMATQSLRENAPPTLRAFALFVLSLFESENSQALAAAANELFLQRDRLTGEGRALLALAMQGLGIEPEKQTQLVSELPVKFDTIEFNPDTFSSATRTEALCLWARMQIRGETDPTLRERLETLMESSASLSTQENLWLLVAFQALLENEKFPVLRRTALSPAPSALAENQTAAAWTDRRISELADFVVHGLPDPKPVGSYVLSAAWRGGERITPLESHGLRIERVVKNLTAPARAGTAEAPFKLGDQLLISYRFSTEKPQSFVAVEDLLPAGIEVVNPNLALFGAHFAPPSENDVSPAELSHSEMRDQQTNLYFDQLPKGTTSYAVLARATAAGTFLWPATQIQPMYDSRFFGRSSSSVCTVRDEAQ